MKILLYRYGSICEPDIADTFRSFGLEVLEETTEITNKNLTPSEQIRILHPILEQEHPLFVFSVNFFPAIAEICHVYKTFYLCWTVDCPVPELFSTAIQWDTNKIFLFDRAQYEYFHPYNEAGTFHLPLASKVSRFDHVISAITSDDTKRFHDDISFVGSLYSEKNPMHHLPNLPEYLLGYIQGIITASLKVPACHIAEELVTPELVSVLKKDTAFYAPTDAITDFDVYIAAHEYLGMQIAESTRIYTLNTLAKYFSVSLYTNSDTSPLKNVILHNTVDSLTEMPRVFHLSKINLNMTIPAIQTGLPLRIFDILGCGGFLITNYQEELPELFDIGVDLEAYTSIEELVEKCDFYLKHDDLRRRIAQNGYDKVKKQHSYENRIAEMLSHIVK